MPIEDNNNAISEISFGDYLHSMEQDQYWGDNMTLVAATRRLGTDIVVVTVNPVSGRVTNARRYADGDESWVSTNAVDHDENTLVLGYIQNRHYVLLRKPSSGATGG